jgi:DGQHR domain-containing protein
MKPTPAPSISSSASAKVAPAEAAAVKAAPARTPKEISFTCLTVKQGNKTLAVFTATVKDLWEIVEINERDSDKDRGYQRVLSAGRVSSIVKYVTSGHVIPTSLLVSFDNAKLNPSGTILTVPNQPNAGWVIDGQHRLSGIHKSGVDYQIAVVAFIGLTVKDQIEQFVKINREAKNVPTSLYIDLLKHLPDKSDADMAKERAADLADNLRRDEDSPFFGKIVMIGTAKAGQISLTQFARKVAPLVAKKGKLQMYSVTVQLGVLKNYYKALSHVFPKVYEPKEGESIFFKSLGFGALINALPTIFEICHREHKGFRLEDIIMVFKEIDDFEFDQWSSIGTGNDAENQAGEDLATSVMERFQEGAGETGFDLPI